MHTTKVYPQNIRRSLLERLLYRITDRLPARMIDGSFGERYLERYHVGRLFGCGLYIHRFVASDPLRGLHDHPWSWSVSLILVGGYREVRPGGVRCLKPFRFNVIRGNDFHRVLLNDGEQAWTLFFHGPRTKGWGFLRDGRYIPVAETRDDNPAHEWYKDAPPGRDARAKRTVSLPPQKNENEAHE